MASTHDGAAVMKKYGNNIAAIGQLCYNHAIHLCVVDSFYKNIVYTESEYSEEDSDLESSSEESYSASEIELIQNIEPTIKKLRSCVKMFKKSQLKQDKLQYYVKKEIGHQVLLKLDVKHRWNSLSMMISTFLKLKECVNHALLDLHLETFSEAEIKLLENLAQTLQPLEIAVKKLSSDSVTLLDSEGIWLFLLKSLKKQNNTISQNVLVSLKQRIQERRNVVLNTLFLYLHSGGFPVSTEYITYSSKYQVIYFAEELFNRLFINPDSSDLSESSESDLEYFESESQNLEDELISTLKEIQNPSKKAKVVKTSDLKEDFEYLDKFSKRSNKLNLLYNALLTINPTSTISERVFSVSSLIKNKLRNRMSPNHLNCILFVKYYFKKLNK